MDIDEANTYVFKLYLEHPELDMSDTWITDMAKNLETCAINVMLR